MPPPRSTAVVPSAYVFFFKYVDPLIALHGAYLNLAEPSAAATSMAPASTYDPDQIFVFRQAGGLALAAAVLTAVIPRRSTDLSVWRILQGALLLADVAALTGAYHALQRQGRLAPGQWTPDDVGCAVTYMLLALVRLSFVLRVGFARRTGGALRRRASGH